jgi:hypothetical protein
MPDDNDKPDDFFFNFTPDGVEDLMNETPDDLVPNFNAEGANKILRRAKARKASEASDAEPKISAQERLEAHARMLTQLGPCPQLTGEGHRKLSELIKAAEAEKKAKGEDGA